MGIQDFVASMTFWNWLALIAFVLLPLSALNAFFGLRTRYRNWQGLRGQKQFDERIAMLLKEFEFAERSNPTYSIGIIGSDVLRAIGLSFSCIMLGLITLYLRPPVPGNSFGEIGLPLMTVVLFWYVLYRIGTMIDQVIRITISPKTVESLTTVLETGLENGLTADVRKIFEPILASAKWKDEYRLELSDQMEKLLKKYKDQAGEPSDSNKTGKK